MTKRVLSEMLFLREKVLSRNNFDEMVQEGKNLKGRCTDRAHFHEVKTKETNYVTLMRRLTLKGSQQILKINEGISD